MRTYVNSKGRKLALCVAIAVFVTFLVVGTSLGGKGSGAGSGSGPEHPATTEQCILCHPNDLRIRTLLDAMFVTHHREER